MKPFRAFCAAAVAALIAGCAGPGAGPRPGTTTIGSKPVILPARMAGNALIVAVKGGHDGPYHFLVDTGSSRTLISPELIAALGDKHVDTWPRAVTVRAADGQTAVLPTATITRLTLGAARFDAVPVLVYDCSALSEEWGVKIDGILGFSLFQQTLLTLDYPRSQVILRSVATSAPPAGTALPMINTDQVPVITVRLGDRPFGALIDSGSDVALSLNRAAGGANDFAYGPISGLTVHGLVGDHRQRIGRLSGTLRLGDFAIPRPVADLTDDLSTIGGGILKFFTVTFDQESDRVIFDRDPAAAIAIPPLRSTGLSFSRTPAYWRVAGVAPGSPADRAGVAEGDLVTKINGEPVGQWDKERFSALMEQAGAVRLAFLLGTKETEKSIPVAKLVP